jgi:hypothetical protein
LWPRNQEQRDEKEAFAGLFPKIGLGSTEKFGGRDRELTSSTVLDIVEEVR